LCRKKHRRLRQFMTYKLLAALGKEKLKVWKLKNKGHPYIYIYIYGLVPEGSISHFDIIEVNLIVVKHKMSLRIKKKPIELSKIIFWVPVYICVYIKNW
jgi:hypothetical protein